MNAAAEAVALSGHCVGIISLYSLGRLALRVFKIPRRLVRSVRIR